jgi:sec-independent protein translocase protein TatA
MIRNFGPTELIILLVIIILLFGVGRIGKIAKELGGGIRSFREGLKGDEEEQAAAEDKDKTQSS